MKKKIIIILVLVSILPLCLAYTSNEKEELFKTLPNNELIKEHYQPKVISNDSLKNDGEKDKMLIQMLRQAFVMAHYSPKVINDGFSEKAFDLFIERLDFQKRFFYQSDVEKLSRKYRKNIDDEMKLSTYKFFDEAYKLITERTNESTDCFEEVLSKPFKFKKNEKLELDYEKRNYPKDLKEKKELWRKLLKFNALRRIHTQLKIQKDAKEKNDTSVKVKNFKTIEVDVRKSMLKNHKDWIRRVNKLERRDKLALYLSTLGNVNDPHTSYFPPKDKDDFDIQMSGQLEGIGATLQESDGYIKIVSIVTGGPAWKQGELENNDLIIKVGQDEGKDKKEAVDIVDMRLDDAVKLIRGKKGTIVRLTVKKINGDIKEIKIKRDIVVFEETYAKSAILDDGDKKIGYIYLPKFYINFKDQNARACAGDIEKELIKLKREKVDGIILDLRNNTGGSLQEVVKMGGFFIEKGPIVQVKTRGRKPEVLSDDDSKVQYDGALAIMVNNFSASASEILAAALQDYDRAIVVGSSSTFGKGTVQRFYDLDMMVRGDAFKPFGALKLTIQKFYRINGGATQRKGVVPDIVFPDMYKYIEVGEKEYDYCLKWDEIKPAEYTDLSNWDKKIEFAKQNSLKRMSNDKTFKLIDEKAKYLKEQRDETIYSLNLKKYEKKEAKQKQKNKKYEKIFDGDNGLKTIFLVEQEKEMAADTVKATRLKKFHEILKKDVYVKETVNVLKDMM